MGKKICFFGVLSLLIVHAILGLMYKKEPYLQLHFCAIDLLKNVFSYLTKETPKSKLDLDMEFVTILIVHVILAKMYKNIYSTPLLCYRFT